MQLIIAPLQPRDQNEAVPNLSRALLFLLEKGIINTKSFLLTFSNMDEFKKAIIEKPDEYGEGTQFLVRLFQEQQQLEPSGEIDQPTADKLNMLLKENGAFDPPFKVSGSIINRRGEPIANHMVIAFDVDLRGARMYKTAKELQQIIDQGGFQLLGEASTNTNGNCGFEM